MSTEQETKETKEWNLKQQRLKKITKHWAKFTGIKFVGEEFDEKDFNQKMGEKQRLY